MDDAGAMRAIERIGDLDAVTNDVRERQRPARDALGERLAFEQLHHQIAAAVVLADVVQRADVRMVELRDRARFPLEAEFELCAAGELGREHFHRDAAVQARVACAPHLAHAAGADA